MRRRNGNLFRPVRLRSLPVIVVVVVDVVVAWIRWIFN